MALSFRNFIGPFIVFLCFSGTPHLSWGFSVERLQDLKDKALNLQLWQDPQWLALGHYRQSWTGVFKSPLRGSFFLSPNGATNPKAELLASLETLFSDKDLPNHPQCRYLARTTWLVESLAIPAEDLASCPRQTLWKQTLGVDEIFIVFAASDLSSAASSFGHTFLRLHNPKNVNSLELLDYGINYAAITGDDSGALYALKGLFGYYPGAYSLLPYHQKMKEYSNLEGRDLWEYKLDLSKKQVAFLIDHLLELEGSYADYYFSNENCSAQLLELLKVAHPSLDFKVAPDFVLPLETLKILNRADLLSHEKLRESLQSEWKSRYAQLGFTERQDLKELIITKSLPSSRIEKLPRSEQAEILEAALSYFAIEEFRGLPQGKDLPYRLSVARAALGAVTQPPEITPPSSPLTGGSPIAWHLGYGKRDQQEFYQFKFRRGFHDLLSSDAGTTPFSHLEFMSFDFRYSSEIQNLDLQEWVLLKILTTHPMTALEKPLSWKFSLGSLPKLAPYLHLGVGYSLDLPFAKSTRWSFLAVSENENLAQQIDPRLAAESLFISKWRDNTSSLLKVKYGYSFLSEQALSEFSAAISKSFHAVELRLEAQRKDHEDLWLLSLIL